MTPETKTAIQWRRVIVCASAASLVTASLVLWDVHAQRSLALALLAAGKEGPSYEMIRRDFHDADDATPEGIGHDGQLFYVVARQPIHLAAVAPSLDRPRYRLQHPLFPWLARALHPIGAGPGLVWAFFAVGVLALIGGGVASGALAASLGGRSSIAAMFPLLMGCFACLRITAADSLATALGIGAFVLLLEKWHRTAIVAAILAVLAKESAVLILAGVFLWRRSRASLLLVAYPLAIAAAWWILLRSILGSSLETNYEFAPPFQGVAQSLRLWRHGEQFMAAWSFGTAVVLALVALWRRGPGHPCASAMIIQLFLYPALSVHVLGVNFNSARATLPLTALAIVALAAPGNRPRVQAAGRAFRPERELVA